MFPNLITYYVHRSDSLPPNNAHLYQYILAGNGLFLRAGTPWWEVMMPLLRYPVRGLLPVQPAFRLLIGRLPESLLAAAYQSALTAREKNGVFREALYSFHVQDKQVRLMRPRQVATPMSVTSAGLDDPTILIELHSHGNIPAFWSSTDDHDEQGIRLYGVMGQLDSMPEIKFRVGVCGHWKPLFVHQLFTGTTDFRDANQH
jgi:PRTRC genetic system protein A